MDIKQHMSEANARRTGSLCAESVILDPVVQAGAEHGLFFLLRSLLAYWSSFVLVAVRRSRRRISIGHEGCSMVTAGCGLCHRPLGTGLPLC